MYDSLYCIVETNSTVNQLYSNSNQFIKKKTITESLFAAMRMAEMTDRGQ